VDFFDETTSLVCGSAISHSSIPLLHGWRIDLEREPGQGLSPCFTREVDGKVAFAFPTLVDISMSVIHLHDRIDMRLNSPSRRKEHMLPGCYLSSFEGLS
jgi:hypothetical protein